MARLSPEDRMKVKQQLEAFGVGTNKENASGNPNAFATASERAEDDEDNQAETLVVTKETIN